MKVLYLDWPCFGGNEVVNAFEHDFNFTVIKFLHEDYTERKSEAFDGKIDSVIEEEKPDFMFSYNYYPLMAEAGKRHNIKYISFIYDSPFVKLYSYTIAYPTNYCFLFDYELYSELKNGGIPTVYYHVLPVNSDRIDILLSEYDEGDLPTSQVSFVGALYNEDHNLFDRMYKKLPDYTKGYLDAVIKSQMKVSGYNFVEEVLTSVIVDELKKAEPYEPFFDGVETLQNVYANYYIDRKITSLERINLLSKVAERFPLNLFTLDPKATIKGAKNNGPVDYYMDMPLVFNKSKINLNISLRSIKSGIPLRCMDILGAGGFLLSNYQADLLSFFTPGEDFDYFEDEADLIKKIDFYLEHEDLRAKIARNGHEKAKAEHNYKKTLYELMEIAGLV